MRLRYCEVVRFIVRLRYCEVVRCEVVRLQYCKIGEDCRIVGLVRIRD